MAESNCNAQGNKQKELLDITHDMPTEGNSECPST